MKYVRHMWLNALNACAIRLGASKSFFRVVQKCTVSRFPWLRFWSLTDLLAQLWGTSLHDLAETSAQMRRFNDEQLVLVAQFWECAGLLRAGKSRGADSFR